MLILSRRCGESIIVNDEVTLTVLSIKGKQVRIGIDAPDDVSVHREEIYQRIKDGEPLEPSKSSKAPATGSPDGRGRSKLSLSKVGGQGNAIAGSGAAGDAPGNAASNAPNQGASDDVDSAHAGIKLIVDNENGQNNSN